MKGHLAQDGGDDGRVWCRHKVGRQMLQFDPCSKLLWPLDVKSQIGADVMLNPGFAVLGSIVIVIIIIVHPKDCLVYLLHDICPVTSVGPLPIWH